MPILFQLFLTKDLFMKFVVYSFLKYICTIFPFQRNFPRKPCSCSIKFMLYFSTQYYFTWYIGYFLDNEFFESTNLHPTNKYNSDYKRHFAISWGIRCAEWGFYARIRLLYTHCRDKSQRRRTAGCNKVYFSWYYVKLASLAELELFKKHSAAVVAVGSLNMHGGKCPRPPNRPSATFADQPAAPSCFSLPQNATFPAHAIILAHLRTLRSAVGTTVRLIFLLPVYLSRRFCDFRET